MAELNTRQRMAETKRAEAWFEELREEQRHELGDALVLGDFDWRDWGFAKRPSSVFMLALDEARIRWEIMTS